MISNKLRLSQTTLLRWLNLLLGCLNLTLSLLLFWIYLFLLIHVFILQWLSLQWENLIMWFFRFLASFHCIDYDSTCTDWNNLCDHLRDFPWEDIFKLIASAAGNGFCGWVQVTIVYTTFIVNTRSTLTHFHGFQVLLFLP